MKKTLFISISVATILLMSFAFVKSNKNSSSSSLLAANIEALTQDEYPDAGEGSTGTKYGYWVTTNTTHEFYEEGNCCYTIYRVTEVDCLPDGQQDCRPATHTEILTAHRFPHYNV